MRRNQIAVVCKLCSTPYTVPPCQLNRTKFCSMSCKHKSLSGKTPWNKGKPGATRGMKFGSSKLKGIPRTPEFCAKISATKKAQCRKHSLATRIKISKNRRGKVTGSANHAWKGGFATHNTRQKEHKLLKYKLWRSAIFEYDNYTCQMPNCNTGCTYVEPHHIYKWSKYPDKRYDLNNGITLCRICHKSILGKEENFINLFNNIKQNGF